MREIAVVFDPERKLFLYFGLVFVAVGVGPFGTYDAMGFWQRTMFWTLDVLGGLLLIVPVLHVFYHSRLVAFMPSPLRFFLGVAVGAIPATAYITLLYRTIGDGLEIPASFPLLFAEVTVFSTLLLLTEFILWPMVFGTGERPEPKPGNRIDQADPPAPVRPQRIRLLERLPADLAGGTIISISMQDHYAEVVTTAGKALVLIRLSDAVDLLDGYPGTQIHRSHWVARDFVEKIEKSGRRMEMVLTDGRRLPVGNTFLVSARQQLQVETTS